MNKTSKVKEKVLAWAKNNHKKVLWLDAHGIWHASSNLQNTPWYAAEVDAFDESESSKAQFADWQRLCRQKALQ